MADLVVHRPEGLYCPPGDFYIDPWRPVDRAVITHAHADHARVGHGHYLAADSAAGVLRSRLGEMNLQTLPYGERISHNGVTVSLHPAGHVLGSAQVRLEHGGQVWVASGDYKVAPDKTCAPFEPVRCDVFITESTFGLPIYRWIDDAELFADINAWWARNVLAGRASVVACYSFGKAQRLLSGVDPSIGPIIVHGAVEPLNRAYRAEGVELPATQLVTDVKDKADIRRALVVCPPSAAASTWMRRFGDASTAFASGWMQVRGNRRRGGWDRGFVLSDHADWPGLMSAIGATGAQRVIVTHGSVPVMVRYLTEQGLQAEAFDTEYGGDAVEGDGQVTPDAPVDAGSSDMKRFAELFAELDATTSTNAKVDALQRYFAQAPAHDAAWAVYFLSGGKPRQVIPTSHLATLACSVAGIEPWLFDECYQSVGDLAETIALVLPRDSEPTDVGLAEWIEQRLLPLRGAGEAEITERVKSYWRELDSQGRFLLTKLVGGGFRVGVSKLLVQRALAAHSGVDAKRVAQRMMGYTDGKVMPSVERFEALIAAHQEGAEVKLDEGQPYPFFLAHQLDAPAEVFASRLGPVGDWQVEWKYDGIRGQIVKRGGKVWVWSRGEELVTERFPEIVALAQPLPDGTVLDGEIMVWGDTGPAPFALLQQRIGRKTLTKKVLADAPVTFMAYDLLEQEHRDVRELAQRERRQRLEDLLADSAIKISPIEKADTWLELAQRRERSRELGVEGLMLKRLDGAYGTGRQKRGQSPNSSAPKLESDPIFAWWKWKIDPMSIDCVLIYAQAGHGRRASVYTDYTFAVWNRQPESREEAAAVIEAIARREPAQPGALQLVAFAKAYSGLTDEEFRQVDAIIRKSTLEKFGPVRSVKPSLVFELGFEGINRSPRHKSGIAVRFPRMLRIRHDKPIHEANTLQDLEALLK